MPSFFLPTTSHEAAEAAVKRGPVGTFVVRNSSQPERFVLVVHSGQGERGVYCPVIMTEALRLVACQPVTCAHTLARRGQQTFFLVGDETYRFTSLQDLALHYAKVTPAKHLQMPKLLVPGARPDQSVFARDKPVLHATVSPGSAIVTGMATTQRKSDRPSPVVVAQDVRPYGWQRVSSVIL